MRALQRIALVLILAALPGVAAVAAEHTVEARPNLTFFPSSLVIETGDTVTWNNTGGLHNVAANDSSFRCANGCDGDGGNGGPSSAAWSFSLIFNDPGPDCFPRISLRSTLPFTWSVRGGWCAMPRTA